MTEVKELLATVNTWHVKNSAGLSNNVLIFGHCVDKRPLKLVRYVINRVYWIVMKAQRYRKVTD